MVKPKKEKSLERLLRLFPCVEVLVGEMQSTTCCRAEIHPDLLRIQRQRETLSQSAPVFVTASPLTLLSESGWAANQIVSLLLYPLVVWLGKGPRHFIASKKTICTSHPTYNTKSLLFDYKSVFPKHAHKSSFAFLLPAVFAAVQQHNALIVSAAVCTIFFFFFAIRLQFDRWSACPRAKFNWAKAFDVFSQWEEKKK